MSTSSRYRTRLLTTVLVACAGGVVLAKTRAPTIFELAYGDLAKNFDAPELCEKIGRDTVERGPIFGHPELQSRYVRSVCFSDFAMKPQNAGRCLPAGLLLTVMGFSDADIRQAFPDHPERDRSYEFMLGSFLDRSRKEAIRARLRRLPDFSRGDREAKRQVYAAVPQCASRSARSFECRRLRCALQRAQDGDLACERELERERPDPWQ
jgi:hypothetical protein